MLINDGYASQRAKHASDYVTITTQRCVQSASAVTIDIFVWTVEPRRSVNYFNCLLEIIFFAYLYNLISVQLSSSILFLILLSAIQHVSTGSQFYFKNYELLSMAARILG